MGEMTRRRKKHEPSVRDVQHSRDHKENPMGFTLFPNWINKSTLAIAAFGDDHRRRGGGR